MAIAPQRCPFGTAIRSSLTLLLVPVLLSGCHVHKEAAAALPSEPSAPAPDWVLQRPVTASSYIGIGQCPKLRPDYRDVAKQNALNDLASEISVTVQGNSLLYTLERKGVLDEEFRNSIRTSTSERMEGYELMGSYDGPTDHYVYYRLDKAVYAKAKEERARKAVALALDLHARSRSALANGDLRTAIDQDLRALIALKDRWAENDPVDLDGAQVPLSNALYNGLQGTMSGVRFNLEPRPVALRFMNTSGATVRITATHAPGGQVLAQLPLSMSYPGSKGIVRMTKTTDAEGRAEITVKGVDLRAVGPEVAVRLDVEALVGEAPDAGLERTLLKGMTVPEARAPIALVLPKVFVASSERNLSVPWPDGPCDLALKEELARMGFRTTTKRSEADLVFALDASTVKAGESNGFHTATLALSLTATDNRSGEVLYQGGRQGLKGIQLTDEKAGMDAFKKAAETLRTDVFPAFLEAVYQP